MTTGRFVVVAGIALTLGAVCLALASVTDTPELAVLGTVALLGAAAAQTMWRSRGHGRDWLIGVAAVATVIGVAFVVSLLA